MRVRVGGEDISGDFAELVEKRVDGPPGFETVEIIKTLVRKKILKSYKSKSSTVIIDA